MDQASTILLLEHAQIDKTKWDECINQSHHGLVYAQSFYLDNLCPAWKALTDENYNWILPITSRKKWGISYLYQPPFLQQSGVFVKDRFNNVPWQAILNVLKKQYRFWEINFNYATPEIFDGDFRTIDGTNFILPLKKTSVALRQNYHADLQRNLRQNKKHRLAYKVVADPILAVNAYASYYSHRMPHIKTVAFDRFKKMIKQAVLKDMVICRQAVNQSNELMAIALFLNDGKRLYNLMNTTMAAGRKAGANHFLLSEVIHEFAGSNLVFDFEGSDLPGVKAFYENFGAINQPYVTVKYNNLPLPIKLLKR